MYSGRKSYHFEVFKEWMSSTCPTCCQLHIAAGYRLDSLRKPSCNLHLELLSNSLAYRHSNTLFHIQHQPTCSAFPNKTWCTYPRSWNRSPS